jgi:glucosamine-6-phosphate deaminase
LKIIKVQDYQQMSKKAAEFIIDKVANSPTIKLGLATGETPAGTYEYLIEEHQKNGTSYQGVTTFNLDEYIGLSGEHKNSYRYYMDNKLFNHIDICKGNTFIPDGTANDLQEECQRYEERIAKQGGIDLQILGIGCNGHIGFNEPGTSFRSKTHIVNLSPSTIQANARFFDRVEKVPTKAITMGISTIMQSKEILLLISGNRKQEAISNLLHEEVKESFPASILKRHPNVTIIADEAALLSNIDERQICGFC